MLLVAFTAALALAQAQSQAQGRTEAPAPRLVSYDEAVRCAGLSQAEIFGLFNLRTPKGPIRAVA